MKTKILFLIVILIGLTISSCVQHQNVNNDVKSINSLGKFPYNSNIDELTVVEIDGCEYIVCNAFGNKDIAITHKGNCKFCAENKTNE